MDPHAVLATLLDDFLAAWHDLEHFDDYYLKQVLPELVSDPRSGRPFEAQLLQELQRELTPHELRNLAELLTARRNGRVISSLKIRQWSAVQSQSEISAQNWDRQQDAFRHRLIRRLWKVMETDYLAVEEFFDGEWSKHLCRKRFERHRRAFIKEWFRKNAQTDMHYQRVELSDEQADAIAVTRGNIQVTARAGAGKTDVLVSRAIFLSMHCGVSPSAIMLLVFNEEAARELESRLQRRFKGGIPHVMTFHALAKRLVDPPRILADDESRGTLERSRFIQKVVSDLHSSDSFDADVHALMMAHFTQDWHETEREMSVTDRSTYLKYLSSLPRQTLRGEYVKSSYEKSIADFFARCGVDYKYEWPHQWNGRNYRPDFTIFRNHSSEKPKREIIIEFFGIENDDGYSAQAVAKQTHWRNQDGVRFLSYTPDDVRRHGGMLGFLARLEFDLRPFINTPLRRLTDEELWEKVEKRAVKEYHKVIGQFLTRCRQQAISPTQLQRMVATHEPFALTTAEAAFLRVASATYGKYLQELSASQSDDFNGVLGNAASLVGEGKTAFCGAGITGDLHSIRYFLIDEFQDFSEQFDRLVAAIRLQNDDADFFCVGDDWQAINRFAGADLKFFHGFENRFDRAQRLELLKNCRSAVTIVDAGNALMDRNGSGAVAHRKDRGAVHICDLERLELNDAEAQICGFGRLLPAVLRIVNHAASRGSRSIAILARKRVRLPDYGQIGEARDANTDHLEQFGKEVWSFFPELAETELVFSTVHRFKGKQAHTVVVLDAIAGSFPSVHPNWVFTRILGDSLTSLVEEEERLLYVAMTRAKDELFLVTDGSIPSPFLMTIREGTSIPDVTWSQLAPPTGLRGWLVVRVMDEIPRNARLPISYERLLRDDSFRSDESGTTPWIKPVRAANFSVSQLMHRPWSANAHNLKVQVASIDGVTQAEYQVNLGRWNCIFDRLSAGT